ncbi:MAG: hypothetical protein J5830_04335 [Clostridia bacterium]|nr:hypothetical protein [Clostridia bacterium]
MSKYFLTLWSDILVRLEKRGVRYLILSAGMMKMDEKSLAECREFFKQHPPFALCTRDRKTFESFGDLAERAYDGICFSFFAPDYYHPCGIGGKFITLNFDKIGEPVIWADDSEGSDSFEFEGKQFHVRKKWLFSDTAAKTDRLSDALIYVASFFPQKKRPDTIGNYKVFRTDHRFHPHFRKKIYGQNNSFCADVPYGYINLYANTELTLSDRVHACAVTMAFGHSAMLFAKTNRVGLLDRVGAGDISLRPVKLDLQYVEGEKERMTRWLSDVLLP